MHGLDTIARLQDEAAERELDRRRARLGKRLAHGVAILRDAEVPGSGSRTATRRLALVMRLQARIAALAAALLAMGCRDPGHGSDCPPEFPLPLDEPGCALDVIHRERLADGSVLVIVRPDPAGARETGR